MKNQSVASNIDWIVVSLYIAMVAMGWLNIYSSSLSTTETSFFDTEQYFGKQLLFIIFAIPIIIIVLSVDAKIYEKFLKNAKKGREINVDYIYKEIKTVKLVDIGNWDYSYKYADRSFMTNLLNENKDFDEVIMVKNGFITDCTIANLAFFDGTNWFTPSMPLLKGIKRQQLLNSQEIMEREIRVEDLKNYEGVCLINAFRELERKNLVTEFH